MTVTEMERYEEDIRLLEAILNEQIETQNELKKEITTLRLKCTPPKEIKPHSIIIKGSNSDDVIKLSDEELNYVEENNKRVDKKEAEVCLEAIISQRKYYDKDVKMSPVTKKALGQLAAGSSAQHIAASLVEELIQSSGK